MGDEVRSRFISPDSHFNSFSSQPLGQPEKAMGHESRIEPWSPHLTAFCFAGFGTDRLRREEVMKTAGREDPNRSAKVASNRAHGVAVQNRSCSIMWAVRQEKVRPVQECFFLTFLFIEQPGVGNSEQTLTSPA